MSMTKEILQTACRNLLRRNVTISSKDTSFGRCHKIEFAICKHTFEWKIDQHMEGKTTDAILNDSFDVMPILPTFSDIDYDPYSACYHVQLLLSAPSLSDTAAQGTSHNTTIDDIVVVLIESLVNDQRQKVKLLTKSFRSSLFMDMIDTFAQEDVFYLVHRISHNNNNNNNSDNNHNGAGTGTHVVIEFPLLDKSRLSIGIDSSSSSSGGGGSGVPELEYLVHMLASYRPPLLPALTVTLTSTDIALPNSFHTKPSLLFPKLPHLPNLRHISLPSWETSSSSSGSSSTLFDFLPALEQTIADTWGQRKRFVSELQQITAVVEFDPVDFSFVSLSLRLTKNKHFILSIVDLRIPAQFTSPSPSSSSSSSSSSSFSPILLLVHDLLSGCSYPLENKNTLSSPAFFSSEWTPERMAREFFLQLCAEIEDMAFGGENNNSNSNNSSSNNNSGNNKKSNSSSY